MDSEAAIMKYICRHLGALAVTYVALDSQGNQVGEERVASYTGFFIVLDGVWFFVTAGHVFNDPDEGLETLRRARKIQIVHAGLSDYFGVDAKYQLPTMISYDDIPKFYLEDRGLGLDFALLPLRDLYVQSAKSNGIKPINEANWSLAQGGIGRSLFLRQTDKSAKINFGFDLPKNGTSRAQTLRCVLFQ